jgi:hypothetical protein
VLIRADVRKKEGGRFRWVADWKCPPLNKELWAVHLWKKRGTKT